MKGNLLQGKKGIIFGALNDKSIAWQVALKAWEQGANYCVSLFSDLTRKVTMQNLFHDGGFSSMGMSLKAIEQYRKSFEECDCEE